VSRGIKASKTNPWVIFERKRIIEFYSKGRRSRSLLIDEKNVYFSCEAAEETPKLSSFIMRTALWLSGQKRTLRAGLFLLRPSAKLALMQSARAALNLKL